jgi:transcription factor MYB, plant
VWNTHLKKKVKQREQQKAGAATPITSSSASSSTSTANSSGEQGGTSKDPDAIDIPPLETDDIDILDMLVDELPAVAEPMPPPSPCSSSSLTTCVGGGVEDLIELPVIDIGPDIWSIIDGADLPDDSGAAVSTSGEAGEASDWWLELENLEKELGLWGPEVDSQAQSDILGQMGLAVPIEDTEGDPVSTYFQSGLATAELPEVGSPAVLL